MITKCSITQELDFLRDCQILEVGIVGGMIQKKITIKKEQGAFLSACKEFGFADQSSLVREALDVFIKETKLKQRRAKISQKAGELAVLYDEDVDLTVFSTIDGDDFHETG